MESTLSRSLTEPTKEPVSNDPQERLAKRMRSLRHDPYRHVLYSYPWGEGALANYKGPEPWQTAILVDLGKGLINLHEAIQRAVAAGHDVGKSALVAWIILWSMSTCVDTRGTVTANTDKQLKTKTWPELAKWYNLFIARHWFDLEATSIHSNRPGHEMTWRIDAVPWDETNPEAFSGLHNHGKRVIVIFDESSAIHDKIWEATDGILLDEDTEILWLSFGNPTRNSGRFYEAFHGFRHRWNPLHVDSRDVSITNKTQIGKWVSDYGEDSDFVRVRVRGVFPKAEPDTLIPIDWIEQAIARDIPEIQRSGPVFLAVDVAYEGDDDSAICAKNGRRCEVIKTVHGYDPMQVSGEVAALAIESHAEEVHVDIIGLGAGVYARLKERRDDPRDPFKSDVLGINVANTAMDEEAFPNVRAEMWYAARESLNPNNTAAMSLPDDPILAGDLSSIKTLPPDSRGRARIEPKKDTKKRLGRSPDRGDAYAMAVYKSYTLRAAPAAVQEKRVGLPRRPIWLR